MTMLQGLTNSSSASADSHDESVDTLWACFEATVHSQAQGTALIHGELEITYGALAASVQAVTSALRNLQLAPGERIALIANKTPEVVTVLLATLHLRVALVVINPLLKAPQVSHILADSGATILLCEPHKAQHLLGGGAMPASLKRLILLPDSGSATDSHAISGLWERKGDKQDSGYAVTLHQWHQFIDDSQPPESDVTSRPHGEDLALILYTSGSTGQPKGVMLSHANLFHGALSVCTYLENSKDDRILALMPFSFDYGLSQLTSAVYSGATLVLYDYLVPRGVVDTVTRNQVTGIPAVPHLWDQLVKIDWPDVPHLRYITSTGGRLQLPTIQKLMEKLPHTKVYSMYGFTEAFRACFLPPEELATRPRSIGKAVPYANVLVVDDDGGELPPGEHGELIQSGPLVSRGYWNDSEGTAAKFRRRDVDGISGELYAWSGDLAYKDEDGYVYFVSRTDDMIKLNGYRVSPAEIEVVILACPWIDEVCVLCVPDHWFGFVAVAFVVLVTPAEPTDLTKWCKTVLPSFMVPTQWNILDYLPVTANNKIDRVRLSAYISNKT